MIPYPDSPWFPIEAGVLSHLLPDFVGRMVLDLSKGEENQRWRLRDAAYDWDGLDELPIIDDQATYEICHAGWLRRSRRGTFSLSPLGQLEDSWEKVAAWLACRDAQAPYSITVWRIRIASLLLGGLHQEVPDNLPTLRAQLNALIDVSSVDMPFEEKWALKLRLALLDDRWYSLQAAGVCLGVTREKATTFQAKALRRLWRHERFRATLRRYLQCTTPPNFIQKDLELFLRGK